MYLGYRPLVNTLMKVDLKLEDNGDLWAVLTRHEENALLNELTYKNIVSMIDNEFLAQKIRASALEGVKLSSINDEQGEMIFFVKSSLYNKNSTIYANTVKFKEWNDVVDEEDLNPIGRARLLMFDGNLELNCTCPSFLYHGYRFLLDKNKSSIFPEPRPPVKRNPQQRGIVCKHMHRVIKAFPFYSSNLANHIKQNHSVARGKDRAWDLKSKIADVLKLNKTLDAKYDDVA